MVAWSRLVGAMLLATVGQVAAASAATGEAGGQPGRAELRVIAPEAASFETVFRWSEAACESTDVPDNAARAWRDLHGQVHLVASHHRNRVLVGPTLDQVRQRCEVVLESSRDDDPARFDDLGWIAATYTLDGRTVHALVHAEFHGHRRRHLCPAGTYMKCWYNVLTYARSTDGGASFHRPPPPSHWVAGLPYKFTGNEGKHVGLFNASNILARNGQYFVMTFTEGHGVQRRGNCLLRTDRLDDPSSWRGWNGHDFAVRFLDPYANMIGAPAEHACTPIAPASLSHPVRSITLHRPSGLYIALMAGRRRPTGREEQVTGIWAASSKNLIDWSRPHLVLEAPLLTTPDCNQNWAVYYPSLLDPDSPSLNFEDIGEKGFVYLTRFNLNKCKPTWNRDLVRVPIVLSLVSPNDARPSRD